MIRTVQPEILDQLPATDRRAVRSREDLRFINFFMRGESWILSQLDEFFASESEPRKIIELGAGDGYLANKIKSRYPECEVIAIDLVGKPKHVSDGVSWLSTDVFEYDGYDANTIVVANLFIHHFDKEQLLKLSEQLSGVKTVIFAEPYRSKMAMILGRIIFPFVNDVTRHDMIVSIRAGFLKGELPELFKQQFSCSETLGLFGGIRFKGENS